MELCDDYKHYMMKVIFDCLTSQSLIFSYNCDIFRIRVLNEMTQNADHDTSFDTRKYLALKVIYMRFIYKHTPHHTHSHTFTHKETHRNTQKYTQ